MKQETTIKTIIDFLGKIKNFSDLTDIEESDDTKHKLIFEDFDKNKEVGFFDSANVIMVIFTKKPILKLALSVLGSEAFMDENDKINKIPELSYIDLDKKEATSKFSTEYMQIILKLCKLEEAMKLSVRNNYPLTAELENFGIKIILAPRVDTD